MASSKESGSSPRDAAGFIVEQFILVSAWWEAAIGNAHIFIFRVAHYDAAIICDQDLKDACKSTGLKRIRFEDVSKL
ncbi:imm11 family protein [Bradyrhizobium sp. DN5]|uniref:imm11 family protein n=1 Tax=Bradyrhizobium sp. DN5 TaxID=3056950 RepID=UPI003525A4D3